MTSRTHVPLREQNMRERLCWVRQQTGTDRRQLINTQSDETHAEEHKFMTMLLVAVLHCVVSGVTGDQRFAQEPQDVASSAGARLVLPCRVEARTGECQWTKEQCCHKLFELFK